MTFWETLILFFSFFSFILAVIFAFKKKGDKLANILLAIFLVLFSYNLFFNVLYWSKFDENVYGFLAFTDDIPLSLYGALFYLYIRRIINGTSLQIKDILHLSPLTIVLIQYFKFYKLPLRTKVEVLAAGTHSTYINSINGWNYILLSILSGYVIFTYFNYIKKYQTDNELKLWLKSISLCLALFVTSFIVYYILVDLSLLPIELDYFITFFMILIIGLVGYFAFMHHAIFNGTSIKEIIPFVKYEKTGLSKESSLKLKNRLLKLMEAEKPYFDSDLRLGDLAQMLDIPRHHTSQVINEHFNLSFFDFINKHRIKEAERLLIEKDSSLTIIKIAYQSGFNNKVSFYKAFKKFTGFTPSNFLTLSKTNKAS